MKLKWKKLHREAHLACVDGKTILGVCFGWPYVASGWYAFGQICGQERVKPLIAKTCGEAKKEAIAYWLNEHHKARDRIADVIEHLRRAERKL